MRIQLLVSHKAALFSSIWLLFTKNSIHYSSFYLFSIPFISPAST